MKKLLVEELYQRLRLPVVVAPMFLVSTPELVVGAGQAGLLGTYLAPNARTLEAFSNGLRFISDELSAKNVPWAVSMIVHSTYDRFESELDLICEHRPPLVISALGSPKRVAPRVQGYGGAVFTDVINPAQAMNALDAGVDGLILLCTGGGGHAGQYSPFAFVEEVRSFWDGPLVLAGAIGSARGILAALDLGADFAYMGTRFLAARESMVSDAYREMIVNARLQDVVTSSAPTGLPANWLKVSLDASGFGADGQRVKRKPDFSTLRDEAKAWKNIWSAGQSVGRTTTVESVREIADQLVTEFHQLRAPPSQAARWLEPR